MYLRTLFLLSFFGISFGILAEPQFGTQEQFEAALQWKNRIYLASYPRSGNHWMRYLIEEATGIATSSIYRDPDPQHLPDVFPWGGYCCSNGYEGNCRYPLQDEAAVVKTHFPALVGISLFEQLPYTYTIRLVRHPIDSFYSLYVWSQNFHNLPAEYKIPREKLVRYINSWKEFQNYWDKQPNVLTIRYEDIFYAPMDYLKSILYIVGYPFTKKDLERAVQKFPPSGGFFKHIDHFTDEDLILIDSELKEIMHRYGYTLTRVSLN